VFCQCPKRTVEVRGVRRRLNTRPVKVDISISLLGLPVLAHPTLCSMHLAGVAAGLRADSLSTYPRRIVRGVFIARCHGSVDGINNIMTRCEILSPGKRRTVYTCAGQRRLCGSFINIFSGLEALRLRKNHIKLCRLCGMHSQKPTYVSRLIQRSNPCSFCHKKSQPQWRI